MRELLNTKIPIVLPTMVVVQAFGTMCSYAAAVVAVQASADLGVKSSNIGIFTAVVCVVAMLSGLVAGGLLARYGVIRTSQMVLLAGGLGLCLAGSVPWWPVTLVAAAMIGMSTGPLTPAGSRILARHSPPRWQPLVFSIKQTGTPMGGMLAGLLLPPLMGLYDWRIAVISIAAIPLLMVWALQFVRSGLDDDRDPGFRISLSGVADALRVVVTNKALTTLAVAGLLYTFVQMALRASLYPRFPLAFLGFH